MSAALTRVALDFGPWEPDAALLGGAHAPEARNVIPARRGYRPMHGLAPAQFAPLPEQVRAGFSKKDGDTLLTYMATEGGIFALEAGDWVSKHSGTAVSEGRELLDYGMSLYALFGRELLRADISGGVTSAFTPVDGAPGAEVMGVVRDFLVLGRLTEYQNGIQWSAIDDPTSWPAVGSDEAQYAQADRQIFPVGGCVQAIVGGVGGVDGLVFLEDAIQRMTYVGTPYIFQFDPVDRDRGLLAPHSPVVAGALCFYLSEDGWRVTDGSTVRGIGVERIDQWFFDACDQARIVETRGVHDAQNRLALWTFASPVAPPGVHDRMLVYNYAVDRWSHAVLNTETLFTDYTRGLTLEELDRYGVLSELPFASLDARTLKPGRLGVFAVTDGHRLANISGPTLEAVIDTAEQGGQRMMCHGFRPLVDSGAAQAMPLFRDRQQDTRRSGRATAQTRDGVCPQHLSCAYLAARVTVPAGDAWRNAVGVEAIIEKEELS